MGVIDVTGLSEEQVKYLERLAETLKQDVAQVNLDASAHNETVLDQTWDDFFRIGDGVANKETLGKETMTEAVLSMRR